jgi:hypothetical protein
VNVWPNQLHLRYESFANRLADAVGGITFSI